MIFNDIARIQFNYRDLNKKETMKKILLYFTALFLFGCSMPGKYMNQGNYDQAIDVLVVNLQNDPYDFDDVKDLKMAFQLAHDRDTSLIVELKKSGQPDIWHGVFDLYEKMDERSEKIAALPDTTKKLMGFEGSDYSQQIENARKKACVYYYAQAKQKLKTGKHADQQKAYHYLLIVEELMPGFRDTKKLLADFTVIEPVHIYYSIENDYHGYLPYEADEALEYLNLSYFNSPKYKFFNSRRSTADFDYKIHIRIFDIKISPEDTREAYYTETAKVQDGVGYKLDENGNFVYDSLGRKIEYPLLKTIACYVTETTQEKGMIIGGNVMVRDAVSGKIVADKNITGQTRFFHRSAKFKGDINALSPKTFELLGTKKAEYPTDIQMMLRAGEKFKMNAVEFILGTLEQVQGGLTKKE